MITLSTIKVLLVSLAFESRVELEKMVSKSYLVPVEHVGEKCIAIVFMVTIASVT